MPDAPATTATTPGLRARSGSILCFHGITDATHPAWSDTHVPLETLAGAVQAARRVGEIVPLQEIIGRSRAGRSTSGLVALTFDDAYLSLLTVCGDFLARESVPATVFVTTDSAASGARFWWDRIEGIFARCGPLRWRDFEKSCGLPADYVAGQPSELGPLRPLRQWVLAVHRGRWPANLDAVLTNWEEDLGLSDPGVHRAMSFAELTTLQRAAPIDIAVHTQSHPVLPLLRADEQVAEIAGSYDILRERFDDVQPVLAIPYGLYDAHTAAHARQAGMLASLTLGASTLRWSGQVDLLPRFCITRGESLLKLHLRLTGVADWLRRIRRVSLDAIPVLPSATT